MDVSGIFLICFDVVADCCEPTSFKLSAFACIQVPWKAIAMKSCLVSFSTTDYHVSHQIVAMPGFVVFH